MPNSEIMTVTSETASTSEAAGWLVQQNFRWDLEKGRQIRVEGVESTQKFCPNYMQNLLNTVFPQIVSAETILFWVQPYVLWPLFTVHTGAKLFKCRNYSWKYGTLKDIVLMIAPTPGFSDLPPALRILQVIGCKIDFSTAHCGRDF